MPNQEAVRAQYEQWIYPQPIADLVEYCADGKTDGVAPKLLSGLYWPDGWYERQGESIDILVAGCGANAAARYAYLHPNARVTGIDLSEASLGHEDHLKNKHNLENLTLKHLPIEAVGELGQEFDFIDATGVLHHLPNPQEGFSALGHRLRPHGVIGVMLYAPYGRTGVYMLQDLFARLGLGQNPEDVAAVRETLKQVSVGHPVLPMLASHDSTYDAGLVDLFLHRLDRAYTVPDCLKLVEESGLSFQGWVDNFYYYPDGQMGSDCDLYQRLQALPPHECWAAMELFHGRMAIHAFYACRPDRPSESYQLDLDGEDFWRYIPHRRISRVIQADPSAGRPAMLQRDPLPPIPLTAQQAMLFNQVNGESTVKRIMERSGIVENPDTLRAFTRNFLTALWRIGYLRFDLPRS